jgi:hypothetical protein
MAQPKPPSGPIESWVERQIREAMDRGEFDNLPGEGKPIPGIDDPPDPLWWIKAKMRRENLSSVPPSLALRKEAEDALDAAERAGTEAEAQRIIEKINVKIAAAIRVPPPGPPLNLMPFHVDRILRRWRELHKS